MKDFVFIFSDIVDPYFYLASEEYLLKHTDKNIVYIWQNAPSVIVGVNQNALEEINFDYVNEKNIKVVRRQTGGGAVYHDLGNVCYTLIAPYNNEINHYSEFTAPVVEYLSNLGVKAEFSGRNDLLVDGLKISGTAQTVYKNRILFHGTLLFSSELFALENALKPNKLKIESKGIKSVKSRVTNVANHLKSQISVQEFFLGLKAHFENKYKSYSFTSEDIAKINELKDKKYSTYEWNIGRSPKGQNKIDMLFTFGVISVCFDLNGGIIENAKIHGDFFASDSVECFENALNGKRFCLPEIESAFSGIESVINGANAQEIAKKMVNA